MRIAYDKDTRGLYIRFASGTYVESEEVSPGVVIDFDSAGTPIALELEDVRGLVDEEILTKLTSPQIKRGADLREFRDRLGMTQELLATLLDIPKNTIARWEREELAIEKPRVLSLALASVIAGAQQQHASISQRLMLPARKTKMAERTPIAKRKVAPRGRRSKRTR